jgi:DNA-binding NarL/FixJ family response regulator
MSAQPVVLVVDDSELACEAVKHALMSANMQVVTLSSPFGFIKAIRESRPSLVLVDVGLGSVNGTKLVQLGREHAPRGCRVLLYSSREEKLLAADALRSGADGYILKSTTGRALVEAVRDWMTRPWGVDSPR